MKSLWKPHGDTIWILNGRLVLVCVCNYSFLFCVSLHVIVRASALCLHLCKWNQREHVLCVHLRGCPSACLCLQRPRTSHDSQLRHNTHRQVWGLERARAQIVEHGLAEQISLSLSQFFPISLSLTHSPVSLGLSVCSLSHCARHRGSLCYSESETQTGAKSALLSVGYHPSLCSNRLPPPCVRPQTTSSRHMGTSTAQTRRFSWCHVCLTPSVARGDI